MVSLTCPVQHEPEVHWLLVNMPIPNDDVGLLDKAPCLGVKKSVVCSRAQRSA